MPYLASNFDQAHLHYRIHNPPTNIAKNARTLIFSHPWPMNAKLFDHLILPLTQTHGYRCISFDRRGFGKSDWAGSAADPRKDITFDVLADDLAQVVRTTCSDGAGFIGIGGSMGCGELVHVLYRHADLARQCKGLIFLGANLPYPMKSDDNPLGNDRAVWDAIVNGLRGDRQGFVSVSLGGMFGKHVGVEITPGEQSRIEGLINEADAVGMEAVAWIFGEKDFTEELKSVGKDGLKILILHGDADQSLSAEAGVSKIPALVENAELKIYENAAHGLWLTHKDQCMEDILKFLKHSRVS